jgi:hypothetical protein
MPFLAEAPTTWPDFALYAVILAAGLLQLWLFTRE